MYDDDGRSRSSGTLTLFALAATIAAVAMLVLSAAAMVFALGWWQGRQQPGASSVPVAPGTTEQLAPSGDGATAGGSTDEGARNDAGARGDATAGRTTEGDGSAPGGAAGAGGDGTGVTGGPTDGTPGSDASTVPPEAVVPIQGAETVAIVRDWRTFADSAALEAGVERNLGAGTANTMTLTLLDPEAAPGGQGGLAIDFLIGEAAPDDFVGFNLPLTPPQDWRGATHLAIYLDPGTAAAPDVVVQLRESSGEVWRFQGPSAAVPIDGLLLVPLDESALRRATWSTLDNEAIDLEAVDQVGIYVGHVGPGASGTLRVGVLGAVSATGAR